MSKKKKKKLLCRYKNLTKVGEILRSYTFEPKCRSPASPRPGTI